MGSAVLPVSVFRHHHSVSGRIAAEGDERIISQPLPSYTFRATPNRGGLFCCQSPFTSLFPSCGLLSERPLKTDATLVANWRGESCQALLVPRYAALDAQLAVWV